MLFRGTCTLIVAFCSVLSASAEGATLKACQRMQANGLAQLEHAAESCRVDCSNIEDAGACELACASEKGRGEAALSRKLVTCLASARAVDELTSDACDQEYGVCVMDAQEETFYCQAPCLLLEEDQTLCMRSCSDFRDSIYATCGRAYGRCLLSTGQPLN